MPQYNLLAEANAVASLESLEAETAERVRATLEEVAGLEQPTSHPKCKCLTEQLKGLLAVRVGTVRCICEFDKPDFRLLMVGRRDTVYERGSEAVDRAVSL